jgi:hypothetical protein
MPRARRLLGAATALAAAAMAAAGCGGGGGGTPDTATTTDRPTLPVRIDNPKPGTVLTAARRDGARLGVTLTVSGRADAAQTIEVAASCADRECTRVVFSDGAGDWSARLNVFLPARRHRLAITAGYPTAVAGPARPVVRVSVREPTGAAAPRRQKQPRRRAPSSSSPSPAPALPPAASVPSPAPQTTTRAPEAPPVTNQPPSSGTSRNALILVGDSLAVGIKPLLPSLLSGWRVTIDARVGRPLSEGMSIISATPVPSDGGAVLAVSLFTNDDPTHTGQLEAAVRTTLDRVGPRGCLIWATIVRPPLNGVSYSAANNLLRRMAASEPRLRIVPWAEQVSAQPSLVGGDGVHPTPAGYRVRAQLYASAAKSC